MWGEKGKNVAYAAVSGILRTMAVFLHFLTLPALFLGAVFTDLT